MRHIQSLVVCCLLAANISAQTHKCQDKHEASNHETTTACQNPKAGGGLTATSATTHSMIGNPLLPVCMVLHGGRMHTDHANISSALQRRASG